MKLWSQYRLIDIMSHIDMSLVEEELPEGDQKLTKELPYLIIEKIYLREQKEL